MNTTLRDYRRNLASLKGDPCRTAPDARRGVARTIFLPAIFALLFSHAAQAAPAPDAERQVDNLAAFARLYSYVRFFHPTDAAAATDWQEFAVRGSRAVQDAADRDALAAALRDLFRPIAPTVVVYAGNHANTDIREPLAATADPTSVVAWQHRGVDLDGPGHYESVRTNRAVETHPYGPFTQSINATPYQGLRIRLRGALKTDVTGKGNSGHLWLIVQRPEQQTGFGDNMQDRPVKTQNWSVHEVAGRVDDDALFISFGAYLNGTGVLWADAFEFVRRRGGRGMAVGPI